VIYNRNRDFPFADKAISEQYPSAYEISRVYSRFYGRVLVMEAIGRDEGLEIGVMNIVDECNFLVFEMHD